MSKVFIDIGAGNGESTDFFLRNHPKSKEFDIFMFEPYRKNISRIKDRINLSYRVHLIEKCAYDVDGYVSYFLGKTATEGTTLFPKNRDKRCKIKLGAVDISKFISDTFTEDDEIILKVNINGDEYRIINHLRRCGVDKYINSTYTSTKYFSNCFGWDVYAVNFDRYFKSTLYR